jgi:hypothetical protein
MSTFNIEKPDEAPDWLRHYQDTNRTPDYKSADRWVFKTTPSDREQFEQLTGAEGVELLIAGEAVSEWAILHEEDFAQAAGEVFHASHKDEEGEEILVMEMKSCSMRLIKYEDGALSWFDTGMMWLEDRFRAFSSVEEALSDPDEMWFQRAAPLISVWSGAHNSPEIASTLHWIEYVDAHEFTINGEPWRYAPGEGVTPVPAPGPTAGGSEISGTWAHVNALAA